MNHFRLLTLALLLSVLGVPLQARKTTRAFASIDATGIAAPRHATMHRVEAPGANLFGAILGKGDFVSIGTEGDEIALTTISSMPDHLIPSGGAVLADDKYLSVEFDDNPYFAASYLTIFGFDGTTFTKKSSAFWSDEEAWSATDMAYDANTKTVYGYFAFNDGSASFFGKLNDKYTPVKIAGGGSWKALACDNGGNLLGINTSGDLCKLDKSAGTSSTLGNTGVKPGSTGSAAFGADGKLYWANYSSSDGCRLYVVDTLTGAATLVGAVPGGKAVAGLCSVGSAAAATPSAATDAELVFPDESLSGNVRFKIPELLADGTPGSGEASWSVATGGVAIQSGKAAYGSTVDAPVSVTQAGEYTFLITVSNDSGAAPGTTVSGWIGPDNRSVLVPPFNYTFETADKLDDFTIVNANNDNKTWAWYNGRVRISYNSSKAMDDWLITPAIMLEAGKLYELTALLSCYADSKENIEVFLGNAATVEAMTVPVIEKSSLQTEYNTPDTFTGKIKVTTAGKYFIGFHGCSEEDMNTLFLHSFAIGEGKSAVAPAAPADLTVTPAADCALQATISFTAPAVDINGNAIDALSKAEILRDGTVIATISPVTPGQQISHVDTDAALTHGKHTYSACAYNEAGVGDYAQASAYIGVGVPVAPASASFRQTSPGMVEVTWDAVTLDEAGNTIPAGHITYALVIVANGQSKVEAENIEGTSYSYKLCEPDAPQDLYYYGVRAVTAAGFSEAALTDMLPVGKSYELPFRESFADAGVSSVWGTKRVAGIQTQWKIYTSQSALPAQDGDNGFASMSGTAVGDEGILSSGNISLEGAKKPEISFWYYSFGNDCGNTIDLLVDGGDGKLASELHIVTSGDAGWYKARTSLEKFIGKTIRIAFDAVINTHSNVAIDNISIREALDHNLSLGRMAVPEVMTPDTDYDLVLNIVNNGSQKAEGWKAELLLNDETVADCDGKALAPDASTVVIFKVNHNVTSPTELRYAARIVYDSDEDLTDNATDVGVARLLLNTFPAPESLQAVQQGAEVILSWNEPAAATDISRTESFEDWKHLATTPADDWTFLNLDNGLAGGFQGTPLDGIDNRAVGFFVIDTENPTFSDNPTFEAHSGKKYLASMYGFDPDSDGAIANDDWLITPELTGAAQTVSFYAKSYSGSYPESFQVLTSSTGTDAESFTLLKEVKNVPGNWTAYQFEVTEGTKYFAIRCISYDCFLFMVDDVTFTSAKGGSIELAGYNIYRDGTRLNDKPVADLTFTDTKVAEGDHRYHVSAVYDRGESAPAALDFHVASGMESLSDARIAISASHGSITVEGAEGLGVAIVLPDGKTVFTTNNAPATVTVAVAPGLYIVRAGTVTRKAVVF